MEHIYWFWKLCALCGVDLSLTEICEITYRNYNETICYTEAQGDNLAHWTWVTRTEMNPKVKRSKKVFVKLFYTYQPKNNYTFQPTSLHRIVVIVLITAAQ